MKIVHVSSSDPAGSIINFVNATNLHTEHHARAICTYRIEEYAFPADYGDVRDVTDGGAEIEQLLIDADVIHLHKVMDDFEIEMAAATKEFSRRMMIKNYISAYPKKVVHHIHGHPNERDPNDARDRAKLLIEKGWRVLASTPDLAAMYQQLGVAATYFPNCVPINNVLYLPRACNDLIQILIKGVVEKKRYMVFQSPTNTILKNVSIIREAVDELDRAGLPIFYWGLMNKTQEEVLRFKRSAHIVFDHMEGYYGLSSLEGLSMGKPTIAGLSTETQEAIAEFFNVSVESLPWQVARNRQELMDTITRLVEAPEMMFEIGRHSRLFMQHVWSDKNVGQRLADLYRTL